MAKTIGLQQLANKVYELIDGLPPELTDCIGRVESSWDAIIYGPSGNGKTNFTVQLIKQLLLALSKERCEYVSYEEAHGQTVQELLINRHNMLEKIGNRLLITDHLNFEELEQKIGKQKSPKIWVIDSIQASGLTFKQIQHLKERFIQGRKKKIIIYISWSEGKGPHGSVAKAVEYYANIKMNVVNYVVFPKSRYGGNKPYVIWEAGAKAKWGSNYNSVVKGKQPKEKKPNKKDGQVDTDSSTPVLPSAPVEANHQIDNPQTNTDVCQQ